MIGAILILIQLCELTYYRVSSGFELWLSAALLAAGGVGLWLGQRNASAREGQSPLREAAEKVDQGKIEKLGITSRELEVLQLIQEGLSNKEIAERLFVSEATVKSHVSNLLVKLDAKRRTQAMANALEWSVLVKK